jgi:hypothetical protein
MKALATKPITLTIEQVRELEPLRECFRHHPVTMVIADWWPIQGDKMQVNVLSEFDSALLYIINTPDRALRSFKKGDISAETVLAVRDSLRKIAA